MQQIILGGDSLWLGRGAVKELGTLQAKRAFIVTGGSSMKRYGFLEQAEVALRSTGCEVFCMRAFRPIRIRKLSWPACGPCGSFSRIWCWQWAADRLLTRLK